MGRIRHAILFLFFALAFFPVRAQQQPAQKQTDLPPAEELGYVAVNDILPEFPGGKKAMEQFIQQHLQYPETREDVEGIVTLSFVVTPTGHLTDIKIIKVLKPQFDSAALQVIKEMPRWLPGKVDGKPVAVRTSVYVRFSKENRQKIKVKKKSKP